MTIGLVEHNPRQAHLVQRMLKKENTLYFKLSHALSLTNPLTNLISNELIVKGHSDNPSLVRSILQAISTADATATTTSSRAPAYGRRTPAA